MRKYRSMTAISHHTHAKALAGAFVFLIINDIVIVRGERYVRQCSFCRYITIWGDTVGYLQFPTEA